MRISKKYLASSIGSALGLMVLTTAPAMAASTFGDHLWKFVSGDGTTTANVIDFNKGMSRIFDDVNLTLSTDDTIYLNAPGVVWVNNAISANSVTTRGGATVTQNLAVGGSATVGGDLTASSVTLGNASAHDSAFTTDVTWATGAGDSSQLIAGDLTLQGVTGTGTTFEAPIMGNLHGDTITAADASTNHAGVIGAYSVVGGDTNTGPKAGVIGTLGSDGVPVSSADAVMAVLNSSNISDDVVVANAAYGVQYLSQNAGSHFNYGLDLFHVATGIGDNSGVEYGTADIRLASGATISSGSATPDTCVTGSLFLDTDGGTDATFLACTSTNTWETVDTSVIPVGP